MAKMFSFGNLTAAPFGASSSPGFTSLGSGNFTFGSSATTRAPNLSSLSSNQSLGSSPFASSFGAQGASAQTKTETAPLSNSLPNPFAANALSSTAGQSASSVSSSSSLFGSSSATSIFGSSSSFGMSSSTSTGANSFNSSSSTSLFGSNLPSTSTSSSSNSLFGTATSTGFSFGASSAGAASTSSMPLVFGSSGSSSILVFGSSSSSSNPMFSFNPTAATTPSASVPPSPSVFGTPSPEVQFGSTPHSNDQVNMKYAMAEDMEYTMAEDTVQASNPVFPAFGQQANSGQPSTFNFGFGSPAPAPSGGSPFQFGGQQNLGAPNNPSPFQADGNLEFSVGCSFSMGSGGGDKANRKFIGVDRKKARKSIAPAGGSPFQFGGQQNLGAPQNPSPFQAGGNLEFSAGCSFSLGSGWGDKANRKFIRVNRNRTRRR